MRPLQYSTITLPNHTIIQVHFCGDVQVHKGIVLRDVLFVPGFKFNLVSVSALTINSDLVLLFLNDGFVIQDMSSKMMIGKGKRQDGLYVLQVDTSSHIHSSFNLVSAQIWHDRLGHLSFKKLQPMKSVLDFAASNKGQPCYICPLAKHRRLLFISHNTLSAKPFDIVHCEI